MGDSDKAETDWALGSDSGAAENGLKFNHSMCRRVAAVYKPTI